MKTFTAIILLFVILKIEAKIYTRCELAQALLQQGFPRDQLQNCKLF